MGGYTGQVKWPLRAMFSSIKRGYLLFQRVAIRIKETNPLKRPGTWQAPDICLTTEEMKMCSSYLIGKCRKPILTISLLPHTKLHILYDR